MIWDALVKIALIGTDRSELPVNEKAKLESIGIDTSADAAKYILEAAAFYTPVRKAGFVLKTWNQKIPMPASTEQLQAVSPKTVRHLSLILSGRFGMAIEELLNLMTSHNKCLPPEILPLFFNNCKTNPKLWEMIQAIIGHRGWWLIEQNPDWHFLKKEIPDIDWSLASVDNKIDLLNLLRQSEPSLALELLQTTWEEEDIKAKVKFLKTFQIGLSKNDEAFLEQGLDHKRKEIRAQAITLLSNLEDSDFSNRMFERAKTLLDSKKDKLQVQLPEAIDALSIRDGIGTQKTKSAAGNKAQWFIQIFSAIAPQNWEDYFDKSIDEIVLFFARGKWPRISLDALATAAINFDNTQWITSILHYYVKVNNLSYQKTNNTIAKQNIISFLIAAITDDSFNHIAIDRLKKEKQLPEENSLLIKLLQEGNYIWTDQLFLLFLNYLQNWLTSSSANYWDGANYRTVLKQAAYKCSPLLLPKVKNLTEASGRTWAGWEKELEELTRTLRFRKEMVDCISSA